MVSNFTPKLNKDDEPDTYIVSILYMHQLSPCVASVITT